MKGFYVCPKIEIFPAFQKKSPLFVNLLFQISHPSKCKACNMASILTDEKLINDLKDVNIDICTVS